ncbi:MAG: signal peptidase I [Nanoarchaeota archaeon]|nr:signal peptidase I [Nanoarchaeota archaeon]MBU1321764.1 signal peptidase I [Nanoarchaeota archaeon]MBU1597499.1 signal peptidase I [Nanoarchaeota archaeon]
MKKIEKKVKEKKLTDLSQKLYWKKVFCDKKFLIILGIIVLLIIGIIVGALIDPWINYYEKGQLDAYQKKINSSVSNEDFLEELVNQNIEQRDRIMELEGEVANQGLIVNYLMERLNMSMGLQTNPFRRISQEDIMVYNDRVIIYVNKAFPAGFTKTKSMYPFIREGAFALEIMPEGPEELRMGDVIGFKSKVYNTTIIHRIIELGEDEQGWYAITKGDNNPAPDKEKVRFENVQGVLVGLIY